MDAARVLRYARRRAGLTQRALAAKADIAQPTIARIESGAMVPRVDTLDRLLEACGMGLEVEPRPGIPPSPQHTVELIGQMKRDGVKLILVEPYFDLKTPNAIARDTGAQVVVLMPSVGGEKEITDYFKLFDYDIAKLKQAFDATK